MAGHSLRSRQWSLVTYAGEDEFQFLLQACKHWAYIYHDKDGVEPHWHLLCVFQNARAFEGLKSLIKSNQNTFGEVIKSTLEDMYKYLTHDKQTDKQLYDKSAVKCDDISFWANVEDNEQNVTDSLIDDILNGLSLRVLARRYGRDFMKNWKSYFDFANLVREQENGGLLKYEREAEYWRFKDMVDGRVQPEEVVALDPSIGVVSQLSIDDLGGKLD